MKTTLLAALATFALIVAVNAASNGCVTPNCPADCGRTRGPDGCYICDCTGSVGAVGRPNYGNSGYRPIACPLIGCGPGCRSVPVPGGCPRCECPRPGRPNYGESGNNLLACPQIGCGPGCRAVPVPGGCPRCECSRPGGGGSYGR